MSYRRNLLRLRLHLCHIISIMTYLYYPEFIILPNKYSISFVIPLFVLRTSVRLIHIYFVFTHSFGKIQAHLQYRDNLFICMRFFSSLTFSIFWSISSKFLFRKFLPSSCLTYEHVQLLLRPWKLPLELLSIIPGLFPFQSLLYAWTLPPLLIFIS